MGLRMRQQLDEDEWGRPINPGDILEMMVRSQEANPSEMGQPPSAEMGQPPSAEMGQPPSDVERQRSEAAEETRRKPIISIHGRDVDEDEIDRAA